MRRPPASTTFAVAAGLVLLAVVVGALLRMPEPAPTRTVYVHVTD